MAIVRIRGKNYDTGDILGTDLESGYPIFNAPELLPQLHLDADTLLRFYSGEYFAGIIPQLPSVLIVVREAVDRAFLEETEEQQSAPEA